MVTTSFIISTIVGLVGGGTVGAVVTGWFTNQAKAKKRVQRRREMVYVDMLAWVHTRIPMVQAAIANPPESGGTPGPSASSGTPDRKSTFPDPAVLDPHVKTDPGQPYFDSLRARVVAFGSHDMARAFDNWTRFYRQILDDPKKAKAPWPNANGLTIADAILQPDVPAPHASGLVESWSNRRQVKKRFK